MEVGTADLIEEIEEPRKRRRGLSGGSGSTPGGGGNNNGGGGDNPNDDAHHQTRPFNSQKSRILTFFLLLAILMTFGGLIAAYIVLDTNNVAEWKPFDLPKQLWASTLIILVSSFTYVLAQKATERDDQPAVKKWMIVTTVLGAAFLSSQILGWIALVQRGISVGGNPYAGLFYILTGVHAVHVLGGLFALGSVLLRSMKPAADPHSVSKRIALSQVVGWYWHFMGGLWIVLFLLLGFWK